MRLELTRRGDYGIRAMLALARTPGDRRVSVAMIAADHRIPVRFLPNAMADLVAAGLVEGTTGRAGGYRLAKPASAITLLDVIEALEGDPRRTTCVLRGSPCLVSGACDVHEVFAAAQEALLDQLAATTLAEIVASGDPAPALRSAG